MKVLVVQLCPTPRPGSSIHGILQARILEWVAIPFSRGSSWPEGSNPGLLHCRQILYNEPRGKPLTIIKCVCVKVVQSCPTLCDPMDYMVHGILLARILEWVAFRFSRGSSQPRDWTQVSHIAGGFFTNWATREPLQSKSPLKMYAHWSSNSTFI